MAIVNSLPAVEAWLSLDAESWFACSDEEYKQLAKNWQAKFLAPPAHMVSRCDGHQAVRAIAARLPTDVIIMSGFSIAALQNAGGDGPAEYVVANLRNLQRGLANQMELILTDSLWRWTCVFTHESGVYAWEQFTEWHGS